MKRYVKAAVKSPLGEPNPIRRHLACDNNARPAELRQLAKDPESYIRYCVAQNPNTPIDVLYELSKDSHWDVVAGVGENPKTPTEILVRLAQHPSKFLREAVALNPSTPLEWLKKLCMDKHFDVRANASNTYYEVVGTYFGSNPEDYDG